MQLDEIACEVQPYLTAWLERPEEEEEEPLYAEALPLTDSTPPTFDNTAQIVQEEHDRLLQVEEEQARRKVDGYLDEIPDLSYLIVHM